MVHQTGNRVYPRALHGTETLVKPLPRAALPKTLPVKTVAKFPYAQGSKSFEVFETLQVSGASHLIEEVVTHTIDGAFHTTP